MAGTWQVLKNHCYREPDDLAMSMLQREWQNARFTNVGINADTI